MGFHKYVICPIAWQRMQHLKLNIQYNSVVTYPGYNGLSVITDESLGPVLIPLCVIRYGYNGPRIKRTVLAAPSESLMTDFYCTAFRRFIH